MQNIRKILWAVSEKTALQTNQPINQPTNQPTKQLLQTTPISLDRADAGPKRFVRMHINGCFLLRQGKKNFKIKKDLQGDLFAFGSKQ